MACVVIGYDADSRAYILEEFYRKKVQLEDLNKWIMKMREKYPGLHRGYGDPSEPAYIIKLNEFGHEIVAADNQVMAGINEVFARLEITEDKKPRLFVVEDCRHWVDEISEYRYTEIKEGKPEKEDPLKVNDHLMDATRYAIRTHEIGSQEIRLLEDKDGVFF